MASGNIQGTVQTTRTNDYGFTSYKISGAWWGSDSKGPPRASEGEAVAFEGFDKQSKDGRTFPTIKLATFRKVAAPADSGGLGVAQKPAPAFAGGNSRDTYWSDKAAEDAKKDPRIAFFASFERATAFVDLALRNGAFIKDKPWDKVKQTDKLQILEAFVDEQTMRIMRGSYAATVPSLTEADTASSGAGEVKEAETEEWK